MMKKILVILLGLISPVLGQSVQQSGNVTPGNVTQWITDGVIGDGGPLGGGASYNGMFNAFDLLCANSLSNAPLIISCGLSATGTNTWNGGQNFPGGATAPTRSFGDNTTNLATTAFVKSAAGGVFISGPAVAGYIPMATSSTAAVWSPTLQLPNAAPLSTVDLQTVVPINGFYASGSGAIFQNCPLTGCVPGNHEQAALYLKTTAHYDKSIAEYMAVFDCDLNSGRTGIAVGISDNKVCIFGSAVTGANAGTATWVQANDLVIGAADTGSFKVNTELDITNSAADCTPGRNCYALLLGGNVVNPITAYVAISTQGTAPGGHYGILINGAHVAEDADIEESGSAPIGICLGCLLSTSHSAASIQDSSASPVGLALRGTYSNAAISLIAPNKMCFEVTYVACMSYDATSGFITSVPMAMPNIRLSPQTIATLPSCSGDVDAGRKTHVTNGVAAPALGAAVSATGTSFQPVVCSGAGGWVYG